jgi:tetratricopeptide (TPR) repeat protein
MWGNMGRAELGAKRWGEAETAYRRSLALYQELGDREHQAWRTNDLGLLAADRERWAEALSHYRTALAVFEELGLRRGQAAVWRNIGRAHYRVRFWRQAEDSYKKAADVACEIGDRVEIAAIALQQARLSARRWNLVAAVQSIILAYTMLRQSGIPVFDNLYRELNAAVRVRSERVWRSVSR